VALIETRELTKLYRMGDSVVRALDGVDLDIERGEFVAITGPSGSGKSTMMHLLGCLDRPTTGAYVLNGRDVSRMSERELATIRNKEIGFVFQTFNLIDRTSAVENVGVPLFYAHQSDTVSAARGALEVVGLGRRYKHRPSELSGGERQRVAIARAIVNDPVLLLADEPTGNLDSRTGEQIMAIFRDLRRRGVTIILVTHEPDVAMQAQRIVQMRDGKIISDRQTSEIAAESPTAPAYSPPTAARAPASAAAPGSPGAATAADGAPLPAGASSAPMAATARPAGNASTAAQSAGNASAAARLAGLAPLAPGANGALVLGAIAFALLVTCVGCIALAARTGVDLKQISRENPPPAAFVGLLLASLGAALLAIGLGIAALAWGGGVLRRIVRDPGAPRGRRRAWSAVALGAAAAGVPILYVVVVLVQAINRASNGGA